MVPLNKLFNKAEKLIELNKLDQARETYLKILELHPDNADAHFAYSKLITYTNTEVSLPALQYLGKNLSKFPIEQQIKICFTIGKANQDMADYDNAFTAFKAGNSLLQRQYSSDVSNQLNMADDIMAVFDVDFFSRIKPADNESEKPIFILGMPRSGSTLIEQILASHSSVTAAGELKYLKQSVQKCLIKDQQTFSNAAGLWNDESLQQAASDYEEKLSKHGESAKRITDKLPGNFMLVGIIHLLFPNAKIIHTTRHPMATCWSNFSNLFADGLHYTNDLEVLARYYNKYQQIMQHWREVLPANTFYDVSYEAMIDDPEQQIRYLLEYLNLPWEDNCLRFYETKRKIKTASITQVRKPIYSSSLDMWRNYQPQLTKLQEVIS